MTRRLPAALAAIVLALSLAACGSDDDPAPTSADATPSETATSTPTSTASTTAPTTAPVEETTEPATDTPTVDPSTSAAPPTESTSATPTTSPTTAPPVGDTPPATYDDALARIDAVGTEPKQLKRFESPSGNLYCVIRSDFIPPSCELLKGAIRDPELCGDGPSQVVGRIELTDGVPQPVCNSDTIREPGAPELGYSGVAAWDGSTVRCLMETIGVTCVDTASTQGFFLAKGTYTIF